MQIGAAGGELSLGELTLEIPPGALAADVPITIEISGDTPTHGEPVASALYELGPAGTTFAIPVTLSLPYAEGSDRVAIWWSNETGELVPLITTVDDGRLSAQSMHFSYAQAIFNWATDRWNVGIERCNATCEASGQYCRFYHQGDVGRECDPSDTFTCASQLISASAACTTPYTCKVTWSVIDNCGLDGCSDGGGCATPGDPNT
ncbi:MAG TPA: hypothetical protein VM261_10675 [Kofleriaceae bacterium]|nr:hypothetical protein [Kofleriaceae bacterium]